MPLSSTSAVQDIPAVSARGAAIVARTMIADRVQRRFMMPPSPFNILRPTSAGNKNRIQGELSASANAAESGGGIRQIIARLVDESLVWELAPPTGEEMVTGVAHMTLPNPGNGAS